MTSDVTGNELSHTSAKLIESYDKLTELLKDHGDDLAPFEKRNALKAQAALWQIVNGLDVDRKLA